MQLRILMMALVLGGGASLPGMVGQPTPAECESPSYLKLAAGDTLTGLFGPDWEKVWQCNQKIFMRSGRPVLSPDLIAAGEVLRVPASTRLTPAATARIEEISARREQLQRRLQKLESVASRPDPRPMIQECRRVLKDDRRFVTDLEYLTRQIEYLEGLAHRPLLPETSPPGWPPVVGWLGAAAIASFSWILARRRANQDVAIRQLRSADRLTAVCRDAGIQFKL